LTGFKHVDINKLHDLWNPTNKMMTNSSGCKTVKLNILYG
jgi:hypothetical protein